MDLLQTILATLVTLGVLVSVHEWGHFWVARRCGVKVLRFSVGFGRPLWHRKGKDGTEYAVAAIPLGGYVRMLDEREGEVPEALKSQAFNNKSVWQRIAIVAAGPLVNLLFAVLAYWFMFIYGVSAVAPVIGDVRTGTPAYEAGVSTDGEVVRLDNVDIASWESLNLQLAAMVGDTRQFDLYVRYPDSSSPVRHQVSLDEWQVNLESETPVTALGLGPFYPEIPPVIGQLLDDGRAKEAGLKVGDLITQINGDEVVQWQQLVEAVKAAPGQSLNFGVQRNGQDIVFSVTPAEKKVGDAVYGYIGAGVKPVQLPESMMRTISFGVFDALVEAISKTIQMISLILDSIWKMIEGVISVKNLSGPITIAKVAGASAASGLESFVSFLAYLSISLGVLNLLPIPMLDGGHLMYYLVEAVRRKPVSEQVQMAGLRIGMAVLFSLMAVAIFNDLMRL